MAEKTITTNRKAYHDFHLLETFEAGIALLADDACDLLRHFVPRGISGAHAVIQSRFATPDKGLRGLGDIDHVTGRDDAIDEHLGGAAVFDRAGNRLPHLKTGLEPRIHHLEGNDGEGAFEVLKEGKLDFEGMLPKMSERVFLWIVEGLLVVMGLQSLLFPR